MEKLNKDNYFKCECGMFKMKHTSCLNPANGTCDKEKPFVITEHEYNNINQPASPPSMPEVKKYVPTLMDEYGDEIQMVEDVAGMWIKKEDYERMRSQFDGLIKQKDEEIKRLIERIPTCNLTKD